MEQLHQLETEVFRKQRAPKQISFQQWREKVDKKEAEMRHQRQRMRRNITDNGTFLGDGVRSSLAAAHEEWVRRKREEGLRARGQLAPSSTTSHSHNNNYDEEVVRRGRGSEGQLTPSSPNYDRAEDSALPMSEYEKQAALDSWLEYKHKQDVAQLDAHMRQERQLLLNARDKKTFTVTQC